MTRELYDVVVVGAGPAGLAAATLLAQHDAAVLVLDEHAAPGGQLWRAVESIAANNAPLFEQLGADYAEGDRAVTGFRASGCLYRPGSAVWQIVPGAPIEVWYSGAGVSVCARARLVILATGAMERPVPVPGWTLPGVMSAGGVQLLLKSAGLVPEGLVLAGGGPLLDLLAVQCLEAGTPPIAVLDTTTAANQRAALWLLPQALRGGGRLLQRGLALRRRLRDGGVLRYRRVTDIRLSGDGQVSDIAFRSEGRPLWLSAGMVALHEGVVPAQQITRSIGAEHVWDPAQHCFRPVLDAWGGSSVAGVLVAGDGAGIGGGIAAQHQGRIAAAEALHRLGRIDVAGRDALAAGDRRAWEMALAPRRFLDRLFAPPAAILRPADDVIVCRCEEVTAGAIRDVARRGCQGPNQAKAFLRAGMGPCQGRMCGAVVGALMAEMHGCGVGEMGVARVRPPLKPVPLAELAGMTVE